MATDTLDSWHRTKQGRFVFGLAELVIAYIFASLAIDSGSMWQYALTFLFLIGAINNFVKLIQSNSHEESTKRK